MSVGLRFISILPILAATLIVTMIPTGAGIANGDLLTRIGAASRPDLPHASDHVLVKMAPSAEVGKVLGAGTELVFDRWHTVPVPPSKTPIHMVNVIASRPGVETVELDYEVTVEPDFAPASIPRGQAESVDDPYFPYQWHFPAAQVNDAWEISTGVGVVVAVLDSGISQDGEDLDCRHFVSPYDAIDQIPGAAAAKDDNGHGTHVAGTIAQCTNNGIGVAGVAFDGALMPVKVLSANGSGPFSAIARGIDWAKDHGADVINMSLGCQGCSSTMVDDAIDAAYAADVVIVAAAGNDGLNAVSYPATHPDVIAVGATDINNDRTWYSNGGSALDMVAPGGLARDPGGNSVDNNGDGYVDGVLQETFVGSTWGYWFFQGTSMASPHVAGAAALLLSVQPSLKPSQVERALECSSVDLGPSGFDIDHGHGLVQLHDALRSITTTDTVSPEWSPGENLSFSNIRGTTVTARWPSAHDIGCVRRYRVYQDGKEIATTGAQKTSIGVTDLTPATKYTFTVRAEDQTGNLGRGLSATVTTLDTIPPKWGGSSDIEVTEYGETSLRLGWGDANDNVGVTGYRLKMDGKTVATITNREFDVEGLQPAADHQFEVQARDKAGNWSKSMTKTLGTSYAFLDTPGHTFYQDVLWMSGGRITRGCNPPVNDLFCPDNPVTRGQMAAFLVRALGLKANTHPGFNDVPSHSTFGQDIGRLATVGITRGCNPPANDLFCPDDVVTRAQMGAFLVRALELLANTHSGFDDVSTNSTFAQDISMLATVGITRGCNPPDNNLFCPEDPVTRGQLAAFLKRGLGE